MIVSCKWRYEENLVSGTAGSEVSSNCTALTLQSNSLFCISLCRLNFQKTGCVLIADHKTGSQYPSTGVNKSWLMDQIQPAASFSKRKSIGTQPCFFIHVLSVAACSRAAESISWHRDYWQLTKPKTVTIWPFTESVCWHLLWRKRLIASLASFPFLVSYYVPGHPFILGSTQWFCLTSWIQGPILWTF